jgi:outer membrane protein TolC
MKIIVFFLVLAGFSFGAEALSLDRAIQKVKENNTEISIAKLDEAIKSLESDAALGASFGRLDLEQYAMRSNDALNVFGYKLTSREASFADFGFKQFDSTNPNVTSIIPDDLNYPQARNLFQTRITYSLPIYTGGKLEQYRKITQAMKHLSTLSREELALQKIYEVKKTFFNLSLVKTYLSDLAIIEKNVKRLEKTTQAMMEEGYAKKVDLLEVQARLADVERLISQAKANQGLLFHYLSFLVNEPVHEISGSYENVAEFTMDSDAMLSHSLQIKKAEQGVEVSKMNVDLQQSAFLPQVGAFAQYGSSDDKFLNDFSKHDGYTVGLQMKWNLFNGGVDKANYEKARVENLKATQELQLAQQGIRLRINQLITQMKSYEYEMQSLKKEVELAHLIYENYSGRYEQKLASMNDVMVKQSEELRVVMKLKEVQNARNDIIFELEKIAAKENQ